MRITRLITDDDVPGQWWIKDPIDQAMHRYRDRKVVPLYPPAGHPASAFGPAHPFNEPWWWKYRDGLDCPHCFGVHASVWVLVLEELSKQAPAPVRAVWKLATSALALSWVVGHVEARLSGDS